MSTISCSRESEVMASIDSGCMSADLSAHVSSCPVCRDLADVHASLVALARTATHDLPDPEAIYRRARRLERQRDIERAALPITFFRGVGFAAGALTLGWFMTGVGSRYLRWLISWPAALVESEASRGLAWASLALALMLLVTMLRASWSEDGA